eukprot:11358872-Alexandrium_andersonii.AAC.1
MHYRFTLSKLELHGPRRGIKLAPEAPEGCIMRRAFVATTPNLPAKAGFEGVPGREIAMSSASALQSSNPQSAHRARDGTQLIHATHRPQQERRAGSGAGNAPRAPLPLVLAEGAATPLGPCAPGHLFFGCPPGQEEGEGSSGSDFNAAGSVPFLLGFCSWGSVGRL